ncbi:inovirus Gp2 family protein, partial [Escherichia coli]
MVIPYEPYGDLTMTYKYNPFWQQRIRETVRHALNVHPRLTALRVDLRFPDVPAATDAAV